MAPHGTRRTPKEPARHVPAEGLKPDDVCGSNPNRCRQVKVHEWAHSLLGRCVDFLNSQAQNGLPVPIRVDLGRIHIADQAIKKFADQLGVK